MRALLIVATMCSIGLAGCVGDDADVPVRDSEMPADAGGSRLWQGGQLSAPPVGPTFTFFTGDPLRPDREHCSEDRPCEWTSIEVTQDDVALGKMTVAIEWEGQDEDWESLNVWNYLGMTRLFMTLDVFRDDQRVAAGSSSSHYAATATITDPEPGTYDVRVTAEHGTGSYLGSITFGDRPWRESVAPSTDLVAGEALPDLVMFPPDHVQISTPIPRETQPVNDLVNPGCGPDETAESLDRRCLRFAGILGNQGNGPFELRLPVATAGLPLIDGQWEQIIFNDEGAELRRVPAGAADYHPVHGHFHVQALVDTQLYPITDGVRGDPIGPGLKTGFCVIDGGLIDMLDPGAVAYEYNGRGCCYYIGFCQLDSTETQEFFMGIMPGWYDIYPWYRADQYIEITGVPDGLYELVSVINLQQHLAELDVTNNEASTLIEITGNDVEMLAMHTQADIGPHPDADWGYAQRVDP